MRNNRLNFGQELVLFSFLLSLCAVIFSSITLNIPFVEISLDDAWSKIITLTSVILAVSGVLATIYFVVTGFDIHELRSQMEGIKTYAQEKIDVINDLIRSQYDATIESLDAVEGVDGVNGVYIRLAKARLAIKSPCTTETEKEEAILEIGGLSRYQEDIDMLQKYIIDNTESSERLNEMAREAIGEIRGKM